MLKTDSKTRGYVMAKNPIQFQKGLSLNDFLSRYGTEAQCRETLFSLRWPKGFVCPKCGNKTYCALHHRPLYQCNACHHQASVTAGTLFASTKLPLTKWFLAIYRLTQTKTGIAALPLSRELGVKYDTAWAMKHKIMHAMQHRDQNKRLAGRIEMDDAYLGGEHPGTRGRGSPNKTPFIAVVETDENQKPQRIQLRTVAGFRKRAIANYAKAHLASTCEVWSDGLSCFTAVTQAGCTHIPRITGGGRKSAQSSVFKWVNTILGNLKNSLRGAYHSIQPKYAQRYLAEFEYRFNRRVDLPAMIPRLLYAAVRTSPMPLRRLSIADFSG